MSAKTILITGGNAGIGKATATILAEMGNNIIIVSRNKERGEAAIHEIQQVAKGNLTLMIADLADFQSIRQLAKNINETYTHIDVLINNAGLLTSNWLPTKDAFEMQIGVNHFAPFLLTHLLMEKLKAAPSARVINVSSMAHYSGDIDFDSFKNKNKKYKSMQAYSQSKLANVLFTKELARRLVGTDITTNCLHPGGVRTDIGSKNSKGLLNFAWKMITPLLITPQKGAATSVFLATSPKVEHITGKYFDKKKEKVPSKKALDETLAQKLWDVSVEYTGIDSLA